MSNNYAGFWIDTTPNTDPGYSDETNFRIGDTGSGSIGADMVGLNGSGSTTITTPGWYTFRTTFQKNGSGNVANVMSVIDAGGNTVGSYAVNSSLAYSCLTGTGYGDWTTVWQNGFGNDVLGIDNAEVGTTPTPEPAALGMLAVGGIGLLIARRRKLNLL